MTPSDPGKQLQRSPSARLLILAWSSVTGAVGVGLAAVAAHKIESPALATASMMLMIHAVAAISVIAAGAVAALPVASTVLAALMLAAVGVFGGDIALHTLTGVHLFPYAAPTGGSALIACWTALAIISIWRWVRGVPRL